MIYEKFNQRGTLQKFQIFNGMEFGEHQGYYESHKYGRMHRVVWEYYNGPIPHGYEIHHKDEDPSNNDISNLQMMTKKEHRQHHQKDKEKTSEHKDNLSKGHADVKGDKNPMFGKSLYNNWLEKYGKEIADEKEKTWKENLGKKRGPRGPYKKRPTK